MNEITLSKTYYNIWQFKGLLCLTKVILRIFDQ